MAAWAVWSDNGERVSMEPAGDVVSAANPTAPSELPSKPTELQVRATDMRDLLRKVRTAENEELTRCCAQTSMLDSIASLLDLAGQGTDVQSGKVHSQEPGTCMFVLNGREYRFDKNEFPEFDAFVDLTSAQIAWRGKIDQKEKHPGPRPTFTDELISSSEPRAAEVLRLIDPPSKQGASPR